MELIIAFLATLGILVNQGDFKVEYQDDRSAIITLFEEVEEDGDIIIIDDDDLTGV